MIAVAALALCIYVAIAQPVPIDNEQQPGDNSPTQVQPSPEPSPDPKPEPSPEPNPDPGLPPLLNLLEIPTKNNQPGDFNPILALLFPQIFPSLAHDNNDEFGTAGTTFIDQDVDALLFVLDRILGPGKVSVANKTPAQNSSVSGPREFDTSVVQFFDNFGGFFLHLFDALNGRGPADPKGSKGNIPQHNGQLGPQDDGLDPNQDTLSQLDTSGIYSPAVQALTDGLSNGNLVDNLPTKGLTDNLPTKGLTDNLPL